MVMSSAQDSANDRHDTSTSHSVSDSIVTTDVDCPTGKTKRQGDQTSPIKPDASYNVSKKSDLMAQVTESLRQRAIAVSAIANKITDSNRSHASNNNTGKNIPSSSKTQIGKITATIFRSLPLSVTILTLVSIPHTLAFGESDCGINRFNNESPLTERIVGGNNSLQ